MLLSELSTADHARIGLIVVVSQLLQNPSAVLSISCVRHEHDGVLSNAVSNELPLCVPLTNRQITATHA